MYKYNNVLFMLLTLNITSFPHLITHLFISKNFEPKKTSTISKRLTQTRLTQILQLQLSHHYNVK